MNCLILRRFLSLFLPIVPSQCPGQAQSKASVFARRLAGEGGLEDFVTDFFGSPWTVAATPLAFSKNFP